MLVRLKCPGDVLAVLKEERCLDSTSRFSYTSKDLRIANAIR